MADRKTTEDFIAECRAKYGTRYDYSMTKYVNANTDITYKCPEHGLVTQNPRSHIRGTGCPYCEYQYFNDQKVKKKRKNYMKSELREIAKKYKKRREFQDKDNLAYQAAHRMGILDEICSHMKPPRNNKPQNYSFDHCLQTARGCLNYDDFQRNHGSEYCFAYKKRWMHDIQKRLFKEGIWEMRYYIDEGVCRETALKYHSRKEFKENDGSIYGRACQLGIIDDICSHMELQGSFYRRKLYACIFPDNYIYIGLSCNPDFRRKQHLKDPLSTVNRYMKKSGKDFDFILLSDFMEKDASAEEEKRLIKEYREKGWHVLNISKGGDLGGTTSHPHTIEDCKMKASICNSRNEFRTKYRPEYEFLYNRGLLDEACQHMKNTQHKKSSV